MNERVEHYFLLTILPLSSLVWVGCGRTTPAALTVYGSPVLSNSIQPTNFSATANSQTEINLEWTDTSSGAASFVIRRATDGSTFTTLATVSAGSTSYTDTGLSSGTTYTYQIKATENNGLIYSDYQKASSQVAGADTWTQVTNAMALTVEAIFLMTDGTVIGQNGKNWYKFTPDSTGSYINGTWSALATSTNSRLYYGSTVLPDGRLFTIGGEYSDAGGMTGKGEIYDPSADTWSAIAAYPAGGFGDDPVELLSNGKILVGYYASKATYLYDPTLDSWSAAINKLYFDQSDEESWLKLPDGSIFSWDIFGTLQSDHPWEAQRYVPSLNKWVDAGTSPIDLSNVDYEVGPEVLLPNNGKVLLLGASPVTALYTPAGTTTGIGSWATGPAIPNNDAANDSPAAVLPNGHVLFVAGAWPAQNPPGDMYDYDPFTNTISSVSVPVAAGFNAITPDAFAFLLLPTGQVMVSDSFTKKPWIYTPAGQPNPSWKPTIDSIVNNGNGTYTLSGKQLNGLDEGSYYGDDLQNSTNYPIIKITDSGGTVRFGKTTGWTSQVATGSTEVTTLFTLPAGIASGSGTYTLNVVTNGISSANYSFTP